MISVSVIIPVFNVEKYIRRCLMSVMHQNINNIKLECLIINDKTQDDSMVIIQQMISKYSGPIQFKIIEHDYNRGLSAARNTGLINAKGDYIFFMDSDDHLTPNCFLYYLENLKLCPQVDMVIGNVMNCKNNNLLIQHFSEPWLIDDCDVFFKRMLRHQIYLYAWNKLIRRKLLINNHILFEEGILYEDQCWSYELFSHLSSVLLLPEVTYIYENNPSSIVNSTFTPELSDLVLKSYVVSTNKILDNPPCHQNYKTNMAVDYLLFIMHFMMNGLDVMSRCTVSTIATKNFRVVRKRLFIRSIKYGRLVISCFLLLLFPPLSNLQKMRFFRRHYYGLEFAVNRFCHIMDPLHCKDRI